MLDIYEFQSDSLITMFGDFYARFGDQNDFIAGVDTIPQRDVNDFSKKSVLWRICWLPYYKYKHVITQR